MLWAREIVGWLLILGALIVLRMAFIFITDLETPRVVESIILTIGGLGILKGGLILIRIATAGRLVGK